MDLIINFVSMLLVEYLLPRVGPDVSDLPRNSFIKGRNIISRVKTNQNMRINTEIKCGFLVLDSGLLPVESNPRHSTYNRGGAAQPKVTVLTVMCQQDSRPEIQAGTLFAPPPRAQPLSLPAVPGPSPQFCF